MAKKFSELKGEGTKEKEHFCMVCQTKLKEKNETGFCSSTCEWDYWKSWSRFFGFREGE